MLLFQIISFSLTLQCFVEKERCPPHTSEYVHKSSKFENYYALTCFLYNINRIILTETETETVAYMKMALGEA